MRKWKDDGSHVISPKRRKIFLFIAYTGLVVSLINIFVIHNLNVFNVISLPLSLFLIYSTQFNGMYKIIRTITEYNLKRKDNKFDYRSWR